MTPAADVAVVADEPLTSGAASGTDRISVRPQVVRATVRANTTATIEFTVKQTADYPLDLYFLMDLSNTMRAHKDKLATIASQLSVRMRSITSNFQLGFGSFVEKPVAPFADETPERY